MMILLLFTRSSTTPSRNFTTSPKLSSNSTASISSTVTNGDSSPGYTLNNSTSSGNRQGLSASLFTPFSENNFWTPGRLLCALCGMGWDISEVWWKGWTELALHFLLSQLLPQLLSMNVLHLQRLIACYSETCSCYISHACVFDIILNVDSRTSLLQLMYYVLNRCQLSLYSPSPKHEVSVKKTN